MTDKLARVIMNEPLDDAIVILEEDGDGIHRVGLNKAKLIGIFLNTPIPIEGGVCSDKWCRNGYIDKGEYNYTCPTCKGTGKLPDKTIMVREAIERVMG